MGHNSYNDNSAVVVDQEEGGLEDYSVWAVLPERVSDGLEMVMKEMRREYGGPFIKPHMTVVPATKHTKTKVISLLDAVSKEVKPFMICAGKFSTKFWCPALPMEITHEVMDAHRHIGTRLGYVDNPNYRYRPHISLVYGNFTETQKEEAMEKAINLDEGISQLQFQVSSIVLYKTDVKDKTLESWEMVQEFELLG